MSRLLILGGTTEARALAQALVDWPDVHVTTSLAGRTQDPEVAPGSMRIGGFGGAEGLASYLEDHAIDALIDATHPFASTISEHAALASSRTRIHRLRLVRPPWRKLPGDRWNEAVDAEHATALLAGSAERVLLTTGHRDVGAFAHLDEVWFLIRTIEPINHALPLQAHCIQARGPFAEMEEVALLEQHRIDTLVTKASGGEATYAKIAAARRLGLPVIMIQRPAPPPGPVVHDTNAALSWLKQVIA